MVDQTVGLLHGILQDEMVKLYVKHEISNVFLGDMLALSYMSASASLLSDLRSVKPASSREMCRHFFHMLTYSHLVQH